jgi:hypothetical protein
MESAMAPAHYLSTSFVDFEKSSTKDYFIRPILFDFVKLYIPFSVALKSH